MSWNKNYKKLEKLKIIYIQCHIKIKIKIKMKIY